MKISYILKDVKILKLILERLIAQKFIEIKENTERK